LGSTHFHSWSEAFRHQNIRANKSPALECGRGWVVDAASSTDRVKIEIDASRESFPRPITQKQTMLDIQVAVTDFQPRWIACLTLIPHHYSGGDSAGFTTAEFCSLAGATIRATSASTRDARRASFRPLSKCRDSITLPQKRTKRTTSPYTSYDARS
jgi:hypothetical protein